MFYRFVIIFSLFFFTLSLPAVDTAKKSTKTPSKKNSSKDSKKKDKPPPFTREMVSFTVGNIKKTVLKGKNDDGKTPLSAMQLLGFSRSFDIYTKIDKIEKVTKISRRWFGKCRDALKLMYKPKSDMDTAVLNRNKKAYKEAEAKYNILLGKFKKLIDNPEKAKRKKRKKRRG